MQKEWRLKEPQAATLTLPNRHRVAGTLLAQRGIESEDAAQKFFHPNWETDTHDPFLFSQMNRAVDRVFEAIRNGERITVHGDYDADGVTGSTVVITTLRTIAEKLDADTTRIDSYIPHRDEEGYGLHMETVPKLRERGTTLIITVDCGIACVDEIAEAKASGMDTIVLDHHRFGETLPDGILIHPGVPGETYPFEDLAAVGVSWKFAASVIRRAREEGIEIQEGWEKWLLDLVAIATVTDMVPLHGENRALLHYGLIVLNKTRRPGLQSLIETSRIKGGMTSETIGFTIGPRINAAGRMEHAARALELLLSDRPEQARERAVRLEALNRQRQKETREMMKEAEGMITEVGHALALFKPEWSPSLVGLVAGRLADKFGRPCIAIGKHGSHWIGSGRSPEPVNITEMVQTAGEGLLTRSGGHAQACGFALGNDDHVPTFAERFEEMGEKIKNDLPEKPVLEIDAELELEDLSWSLLELLDSFEPFGMGNPMPVFCTRNLRIVSADQVGKTSDHLRLTGVNVSGRSQSFIGFRMGDRIEEVPLGKEIDVVYHVGTNVWNGRKEISCKLIDFHALSSIH